MKRGVIGQYVQWSSREMKVTKKEWWKVWEFKGASRNLVGIILRYVGLTDFPKSGGSPDPTPRSALPAEKRKRSCWGSSPFNQYVLWLAVAGSGLVPYGFFLHDQNRNSRLRLCTLCVLTIFLKYRFSFTIVPWLSLGGPGCLLRLWSQDFGYERTWTVVQGDSTSAVKTFKRSTVVELRWVK